MDATVPENELARIERWCHQKVPDHARHQVRIECAADGRDVVISEAHLTPRSLSPRAADDWLAQPVARLRYLKSRGIWRLYWVDSNDRWHEYPDLPWAHDVPTLLAEIDRDPDALLGLTSPNSGDEPGAFRYRPAPWQERTSAGPRTALRPARFWAG